MEIHTFIIHINFGGFLKFSLNVKYFKFFGSKCYIKRTDEKLGKFEPRANEAGKNPKQVKTEDYEEDEDYPSTSNQTNSKEETNEAPKE